MVEIRSFNQLGKANHGWLKTSYHFSFSNYYNPTRMHWGNLRVWNDDTIAPKSGFPMHPHEDMEIITYVYEGAISHKDNLGHSGKTTAGNVQVMSAGTGITHSEFNNETVNTKLFQIWILPNKKNRKPSWGNKKFPKTNDGEFKVLASGFDQDIDALKINTKARVLAITLKKSEAITYRTNHGFKYYCVASKGHYSINENDIKALDGVAIKDEKELIFKASEKTEIILIETQ